jgi:hypothetical protein
LLSRAELGKETELENWFRNLYQELISGKACCHLEDDKKWSWVREYYYNKILLNGGNANGICERI